MCVIKNGGIDRQEDHSVFFARHTCMYMHSIDTDKDERHWLQVAMVVLEVLL